VTSIDSAKVSGRSHTLRTIQTTTTITMIVPISPKPSISFSPFIRLSFRLAIFAAGLQGMVTLPAYRIAPATLLTDSRSAAASPDDAISLAPVCASKSSAREISSVVLQCTDMSTPPFLT